MTSMALPLVLAVQAALLGVVPDIPGYEGETRKVIERALGQYRTLKTYQDTLVIANVIEVEGDRSMLPSEDREELSLAFARPNRIALRTTIYSVVADGKQLWEQITPFEQYVVSPAPKNIDLSETKLNGFGVFERADHPLVWTLTGAGVFENGPFMDVTRFNGTKTEVLGGKAGIRISGEIKIEPTPGRSVTLPFDAWFNQETGLIEEIRHDHTKPLQENMALFAGNATAPKLHKFVRRFRFKNIRADGSIPDDRFAFEPGTYDRKMVDFKAPDQEQWQDMLIGRPAPPFEGKNLQGKRISHTDFKGQVVLLDFWASWCGPCIMAMPGLQKIADQFKGKGVTILGINGDRAGSEKQVGRLLKQRKISYPQLLDPTDAAFSAYRVSPIPCIALIDKNGIIATIERGYIPNGEARLVAQIKTLLKGEKLRHQ